MPMIRPPYLPQFRDRIIELSCAARSVSGSAKAFKSSDQAIRSWVKQADVDVGVRLWIHLDRSRRASWAL